MNIREKIFLTCFLLATPGLIQGVDWYAAPTGKSTGNGSIAVDVSSVVPVGASYQVRNAQDWYAGPILSGIYNGQPLTLPMTGLTVAKPIGLSAPAPTGPQFNAFVITSQ